MVYLPGIAQRLVADTPLEPRTEFAMPAVDDDTLLPFSLPNICKKKVTATFEGGQVSSDGGVFLLAAADKLLGLINTLARLIPLTRAPPQMTHSTPTSLRDR